MTLFTFQKHLFREYFNLTAKIHELKHENECGNFDSGNVHTFFCILLNFHFTSPFSPPNICILYTVKMYIFLYNTFVLTENLERQPQSHCGQTDLQKREQ